MRRRRGVLVAIAFAAGAFLGLGASSLFLDIDSRDLRAATEAQMANESGPLAAIASELVADRGIFEGAAAEIRRQQRRNVAAAGLIAVATAIALGIAIERLDRRDSPPSNSADARRKPAG